MSHQGQHDEFLFLFRDDDDDGVVESRAMIFHSEEAPPSAVMVVDCSVPTSCAGSGSGSCFVSTNGRRP